MHTFGPIENILQILNYQKKGPHFNNIKRFVIHKEAASDNQLNDKQTLFPNQIFDEFYIRVTVHRNKLFYNRTN